VRAPYRALLCHSTYVFSGSNEPLSSWCSCSCALVPGPNRQLRASPGTLAGGALWDLLANDYAATYLDASFVAAIPAHR
jgi:hypothetical protein